MCNYDIPGLWGSFWVHREIPEFLWKFLSNVRSFFCINLDSISFQLLQIVLVLVLVLVVVLEMSKRRLTEGEQNNLLDDFYRQVYDDENNFRGENHAQFQEGWSVTEMVKMMLISLRI